MTILLAMEFLVLVVLVVGFLEVVATEMVYRRWVISVTMAHSLKFEAICSPNFDTQLNRQVLIQPNRLIVKNLALSVAAVVLVSVAVAVVAVGEATTKIKLLAMLPLHLDSAD